MIINALKEYYEQLLEDDPKKVSRFGWCQRKVSFDIELSFQGELINIIPTAEDVVRNVPYQEVKTSGVRANILCDNSGYFLGLSLKDQKKGRIEQCFTDAREKHIEFLKNVDSPVAQAVLRFFETWDPAQAQSNKLIQSQGDISGNLCFQVEGKPALQDEKIVEAWDKKFLCNLNDSEKMTCLVTGEYKPIELTHGKIKGIKGTSSAGANLISFNEKAFESYGRDDAKGYNAPVSKDVAFAYVTALNYLLSNPKHRINLVDTTVVFWAEKKDEECIDVLSLMLGLYSARENIQAENKDKASDQLIDDIMKKISKGYPVNNIDPSTKFYVLGLKGNNGRASVAFFLNSSFGNVLSNLKEHYERLEIISDNKSQKYLFPWRLLRELETSSDKKQSNKSGGNLSYLGSALLYSILTGRPYPEALYQKTLLRICATHEVTYGRAAIVKAFFIKNRKWNQKDEVVTVELNESRVDTPYILGRLFSVLEEIQDKSNGSTNIKERFFNSACATPGVTFPNILLLSENHMAKLARNNRGAHIALDKKKTELLARLTNNGMTSFPRRLSNEEQGSFILGYYQEHQNRFQKEEESKEE